MGHFVIFLSTNCERESSLLLEKVLLVMGLMFFGMGLGAYYSVCFPAVGLTVPQQIRGIASPKHQERAMPASASSKQSQ
jgi:hypothetical protein